jgi:hypothetical protein
MRILITGSRHWIDYRQVQQVIRSAHETTTAKGELLQVRHGDATGADHLAKMVVYGLVNAGYDDVIEEPFPADWSQGKVAGMMRNRAMLEAGGVVDEVHAFPLQDSKGTVGMMKIAAEAGIPVFNHGWPGFNDQIPNVINVTKPYERPEDHNPQARTQFRVVDQNPRYRGI